MRKYIILPFLLLLFGCTEGEVSSNTNNLKDDSSETIAVIGKNIILDTEKTDSQASELEIDSIKIFTEITVEKGIYFGKLDLYATQIVVTLSLEGDKVKGQYYYSKSQKYLQLSGNINNTTGEIELQEKYKGKVSGYFKGILTDSTFIGEWSSNQKMDNSTNFLLNSLVINSDDLRTENEKFVKFKHVHESALYNSETDEYELYETEDNIRINFIDDYQFDFIYKVNGTNGHSGSISGLAIMESETKGTYSDSLGCVLNFSFNKDAVDIEVIGDCSEYAGARAGFGGNLIRY